MRLWRPDATRDGGTRRPSPRGRGRRRRHFPPATDALPPMKAKHYFPGGLTIVGRLDLSSASSVPAEQVVHVLYRHLLPVPPPPRHGHEERRRLPPPRALGTRAAAAGNPKLVTGHESEVYEETAEGRPPACFTEGWSSTSERTSSQRLSILATCRAPRK
ncbi:hypothetical protein THAOC_23930 [Thalassiosira oceanica]|uniref:Uncharacterized protein n=1 Tax=Thalassiosira oceanica TaxID=159749 RepID=K0SC24_THAOC|nr:hypothetical protein THAOC_23930 [Thalassiosira oceanica]|eukprot:EJK56227.1 hypothetical protein THAOC_23930 [Thalassiosira oceanica]